MSEFFCSPMSQAPTSPPSTPSYLSLNQPSTPRIMNITDLPNDIFLLILDYLSPRDLIISRRVSKVYHAAFTDTDLNHHVLTQHYPRVRELRDTSAATEIEGDWARVFSRVASRYHHLQSGKPLQIDNFPLCKSFVVPRWSRSYPVVPWQRYLQFEEKSAPFHYSDTLWTYDDGLLIFPSQEKQRYVLHDLERRTCSDIDIGSEGKIVRRIRLRERLLVVEWCEEEAYHQLNENEMVYRHFATAFSIIKHENEVQWEAVLKNEWKIHFLGMPLNSQDRFFSTHTQTHYALYLWQPNRSAWGEDEPIEALAIWDISSPSLYRPSLDPAGRSKPFDTEGPQVLRRFSFADLDFYGIRQGATPVFQGLELDQQNVYVVEEDHRWIVGQQAGHTLPRLHKVKTIGIPFEMGPRWEDECGADGDVNLSFCERVSDTRTPEIAPCWRHEEFPYLTITEARDSKAGVCFSARQCFMLETISISIQPKIHMTGPGYDVALRDDLWGQLLGKGKICGDERWLLGENARGEVVVLRFEG